MKRLWLHSPNNLFMGKVNMEVRLLLQTSSTVIPQWCIPFETACINAQCQLHDALAGALLILGLFGY